MKNVHQRVLWIQKWFFVWIQFRIWSRKIHGSGSGLFWEVGSGSGQYHNGSEPLSAIYSVFLFRFFIGIPRFSISFISTVILLLLNTFFYLRQTSSSYQTPSIFYRDSSISFKKDLPRRINSIVVEASDLPLDSIIWWIKTQAVQVNSSCSGKLKLFSKLKLFG